MPRSSWAGQMRRAGLYCGQYLPWLALWVAAAATRSTGRAMRFDQHAFISYAHLDDKPLSPHQQGWVSRFHVTLDALLSMRIGYPARIWRDDRLHGNDLFPSTILDQFNRTAVLISVLTPRYLASDWCTRELQAFCDQADKLGGLQCDKHSRVFKVLKSPVDDRAPLPPVMKDMLGYPFFVLEDGAPLELDAAYGERFEQDYNRRVAKLAWDAAQLIKQLEDAEAPAAPANGLGPGPSGTPALTVYLAECSHDCRPDRERLEAELKCRGHTVLPDQRLRYDDADACGQQVAQWLARADLAIHLIGNRPGAVPDGAHAEPIVALQNRLAAERSAARGLPRLIWLAAACRSDQPAHQAYLEALRRDAALQRGADLLDSGLDSLLQALHSTLERLARPPTPTPPTAAGNAAPLAMHLLCVSADRQPSLPLRRWLRDQGVELSLPAFEGSAAELRTANLALLAQSDAVLLYYGAGDEAWKRGVDSLLKKQLALSERATPPALVTYLAGPPGGDKDDLLAMQASALIDGLAALPEAALAALLARLRGGRPGA